MLSMLWDSQRLVQTYSSHSLNHCWLSGDGNRVLKCPMPAWYSSDEYRLVHYCSSLLTHSLSRVSLCHHLSICIGCRYLISSAPPPAHVKLHVTKHLTYADLPRIIPRSNASISRKLCHISTSFMIYCWLIYSP